jgi:alpha-glucosidase
LNLNDPPAPNTEVGYIKPGKYMGIWWEMHIGNKDWSPGPLQGATTERAMQYIDFASQHDIDGVLVEGWNQGWEGQWWQRTPTFSFTKPVKGFDLEKVAAYAKSKGVRLIGHHETAAGVKYYEQQMADGLALYQKLGINSVKMGYVGTRIDQKQWHHGQYMVEHFQRLTETAASYGVMVNAHETIKDTGLSRTFPNLMTRECVRGMEYNGGSPDTGNLPNHTVIIPFTRGLAGPIDFTPGIFNFNYQQHRPRNRVPSTLANQLALYVMLYSPLQMAADLPENYQDHPAFAFIDAVPTDWQQSIALQGKIGEYLVVARQDRHSANWFLGATSNEQARQLTVPLDFLTPGKSYQMIRYQDAADAHWETNPMAYQIDKSIIKAGSTLVLQLQPGGGTAIEFIPQ